MDYDLSLGERLDVLIGERRCISNVQEITREGTLIISAPTFRSVTVPIREGELVNVVYFRQSGMFSFVAALLRRFVSGELEFCEIEIKSPISKYQRRDFVRFETVIPVKVSVLADADVLAKMSIEETLKVIFDRRYMGLPRPNESEADECLSLDISGGGIRFASKEPYEKNTLLECTLEFQKDDSMTVDVLVVRSEQPLKGEPHRIGAQYVNIEERLRRRIIKYIFEEQVKERQKL